MMTQVFRFAAKDFMIQKKSVLSYFIIGIGLFVMLSLMNLTDRHMIFSMITFVIVYGFANKALYEDEKNNALRLLVSLPVKRKVIVYARYLSIFMTLAATVLILFGISAIFPDTFKSSAAVGEGMTFLISIITAMVFIIMLSVYLPMAYKMGYIKAANMNRLVFVGIFALFGGAGAALGALSRKGPPPFLAGINRFLASVSPGVLLAAAIAAVLLVYLGSMLLAVRFFNRRNLF